MGVLTGPQKGQQTKLNVTKEAQHRMLIGLSWDANELSSEEKRTQRISSIKDILFGDILLAKANFDRMGQKMDTEGREEHDPNFDLDLSCFALDCDGNIKSVVDPSAWNAIDETGKIYHSGDAETGIYAHDDEQIHIELKDLSTDIEDIFLVVQSDCKHSIDKIKNAQIRVADSMTDKNFLAVDMNELENNEHFGFVFCRIFKQETEWHVENISEFCKFDEDWNVYLKQFINKS